MNCAFCASQKVLPILDFGAVALAGAFLKPQDFVREKRHDLTVMFCEACYALQVESPVDPETLFRNYFYHSSVSATVRRHAKEYAAQLVQRFGHPQRVIEIGCNDGVLLRELALLGVTGLVGVDPSNVARTIDMPGVKVVNDYFSDAVAVDVGKADLIIANNVFAHIPAICRTTLHITRALQPDGVFVFEVHDLARMISGLQYDWIYHEHLYYYSTLALCNHFGRYGLTVFDLEPVSLHGGSVRYYVGRTGKHAVTQAVVDRVREERRQGLDRAETFMRFASYVQAHRKELSNVVSAVRELGASVAGYGASGRGNALIQYCDLDLDYVVDDAPAKHGYYTPGSHIPIYPSSRLKSEPTEYLLLLAWGYVAEIAPKCPPMPMIVPLPEVRVERQRMVA